ncbi:hypothetical protein JXR93_03175 [bacterium]|nr:hypothetical protein [bacterium]
MKNKLRKIFIKNTLFYWKHSFKYQKIGLNYESFSKIVVYMNGYKNRFLIVNFRTWEDAIIGNPLNVGIPINNQYQPINLNKPSYIKAVIEYALKNGWSGKNRVVIEDGLSIFIKNL